MIISLLGIIAQVVLAFVCALVMAIAMQSALSGTAKSAIDRYAITIMAWTVFWTIVISGLPKSGINGVPIVVGFFPVALAHCRVAKRQHGRYPDVLILIETIRNVRAPFIAIERRFVAKKSRELGTRGVIQR